MTEKSLAYANEGGKKALNRALDVLLEESEEKQHPLRDLAPPVIDDDEVI